MTYRGKVRNGVVVLEGPQTPPEGATVSVRVLGASNANRRSTPKAGGGRFADIVGIIKDLPADFSENLDHYLYGTAKKR